uniref:Uncharacterized protein n=1 Tax=Ditylenchus dipsaci TaxID=166011 RepID=A0A915DAP6_9BILA
MKLKYLSTLIDSTSNDLVTQSISTIGYSPNGKKLAIGSCDRQIVLLDEKFQRRDKFATKPVDSKFGKKSYVLKCLVFSPDSTKLAVGQTDNIVFVYRLGNSCPSRRSFASGHVDGSIVVYSFESRAHTKVRGSDRRIVSYNVEHAQGRILQDFDYSRDPTEKDLNVAVLDSTGHNAVFASFNRFRLMSWNVRRGAWEEGTVLNIKNFYTITALAWKPDVGSVLSIDCCMSRSLLKHRFETTYVSPSQVVIKDVSSVDQRQCVIRSGYTVSDDQSSGFIQNQAAKKSHPITDIRIMGRTNRYVIANTPYTMILADMENDLSSEIPWDWSGNEKYYLDNENVCMIVNAGEITFVEYGRQEIAGWIRTEKANPHQISVRINEKKRRGNLTAKQMDEIRRVAYLLDVHTISIVNLISNSQLAQIAHSNAVIDWIELNESGNKLLYRDRSSLLFLFDLETQKTSNMINFCSYVQWVPRSDVVVAQSNGGYSFF